MSRRNRVVYSQVELQNFVILDDKLEISTIKMHI
jgi:hypothetical protein